jgi:hypothetical protein
MHIHDFYSKLTSLTEEGNLFQALRNLSLVEDPQRVLNVVPDGPFGEWAAWPPMEAGVACAAC